ncbi:MAG: DNA polymerase III subunit epsilon, partial [Pseudomonadales bacterium]
HRELHGALLDSEILADVYLMLTGGQTNLILGAEDEETGADGLIEVRKLNRAVDGLPVVRASESELAEHEGFLNLLDKKAGEPCQWRQ